MYKSVVFGKCPPEKQSIRKIKEKKRRKKNNGKQATIKDIDTDTRMLTQERHFL